MADELIRISQLPALTEQPDPDSELPIVEEGVTHRVAVSWLRNGLATLANIAEALTLSAYSIMARATGSSGVAAALTFGTNTLLARVGSGNLAALTVPEGTVVRRVAGGTLETGTVDDRVCAFSSPDAVYAITSVAPGGRSTASISDGASWTSSFAPTILDTVFRTVWLVRLRISGVDYVADHLVISRCSSSGVVTVLEYRPLTSVPPGVTVSAVASGSDVELTIENDTGSTISAAASLSHLRESTA